MEKWERISPTRTFNPIDGIQFVLDIAGLIPGAGEVFDGINAVIYLARGDKTNAALSGAAMAPFVGSAATGGKLLNKTIKYSDEVFDVGKGIKNTADGTGEGAKKTDFFVAPSGEAIPTTKDGIMDNLAKLTEKNGKYYGTDSNGPIRINPNEVHKNNPNHTGPMSDMHTVPHMHIDRKVNGTTGDWIHKITLPWNMFE